MWIEIKEGCEMPKIDEFVLWKTEDENYFVAEIDKDDPDWWNGSPLDEGRQWRPKCTHWKRIIGPSEEPNQDILWREVIGICFNDEGDIPWKETAEHLSEYYTISRKQKK